jgi:mannose-1-phosphate guanylyltransferase
MRSSCGQTWGIVLAAGEGTRLRPLVRALYGRDLPKQFAAIVGERSLLQQTVERASLVAPEQRTLAIVASDRERLAREQLADWPDIELVGQPRNLGTGPGVLFPLARILARDPDALVVVLPSDHYVTDSDAFVRSLERAKLAAAESGSIVLLGAVPDAAESEYGWIRCSATADATGAAVESFEEKPSPKRALELFRGGALWNTFIMVGKASAFWSAARRHLPAHTALLGDYRALVGSGLEQKALVQAYENMQPADFSRDVLEAERGLRVVALEPCGWSDWGTPRRVLTSLEGTPAHARLVERLRRTSCPPVMAILAAIAAG